MIACIQRVKSSYVNVDSVKVGEIGKGLNILIGFSKGDSEENIEKLAKKCCELRIFEDQAGKMGLSVKDIGGEILVISQFTLAGDTKKGRRPDFTNALSPDMAKIYYNKFILECKKILGDNNVKNGVFGATMEVMILNDGPVTFVINM
ncbi:MAG: D-tyrosyl-tRNA(Tyr) deacylase [Deferribacterales bacterium]